MAEGPAGENMLTLRERSSEKKKEEEIGEKEEKRSI